MTQSKPDQMSDPRALVERLIVVKDGLSSRFKRDTISDACNALTAALDEVARMNAAIKRQAGAAKTLRELTLAEVQHIRDAERKEYIATQTLDSEREANAILTEENAVLRTEKHADAEAIGALRDALDGALTIYDHADFSSGVCMCGDDMDDHSDPMDCGHSAVDSGEYAVSGLIEAVREVLKGSDQ